MFSSIAIIIFDILVFIGIPLVLGVVFYNTLKRQHDADDNPFEDD